MPADTRGPISWQQAARIRNEQRYGPYGNISRMFPIPDGLADEEFRHRLSRIVRREEALWISDGFVDRAEGWIAYNADAGRPVRTIGCGSLGEAAALAEETARVPFPRGAGPLWELLVFEHPDESGHRTRTACAVMDHMVSDGRSMHLLQQELTEENSDGLASYRGRYRDWVAWVREHYHGDGGAAPVPEREFWLRLLGGAEADAATTVPFATLPAVPFGGFTTRVTATAEVSLRQMALTSRRRRTTPFLFAVTAAVTALARSGQVDDLVFRVITSGRPTAFMNTLGWFADSLPMRLRDRALDDQDRVLELATPMWARMMAHQDTPWDYIRTACSPSRKPVWEEPGSRQLVVNFQPFEAEPSESRGTGAVTFPGHIESLHLVVAPTSDGCCELSALFNADHFSIMETQRYTEAVADCLTALVEQDTAVHQQGHQRRKGTAAR